MQKYPDNGSNPPTVTLSWRGVCGGYGVHSGLYGVHRKLDLCATTACFSQH